jgi:hypothetical protein
MNKSFDVFLSHNSKDKPAVRELAEALRARGLKVWLDEWELVPGRPWQEALEEVIETARASAVLVGKDGLGPWQDREMRGCLTEFVDRKLPVIPVLLPGAPEKPSLPLFLKEFTWVDLRGGLTEEGLDRLQWGVTGKKPDRGGAVDQPPSPDSGNNNVAFEEDAKQRRSDLAIRYGKYVMAFGVAVVVGMAPFLGKYKMPMFEALLELFPEDSKSPLIPISALLMGLVAVVTQLYSGERIVPKIIFKRLAIILMAIILAIVGLINIYTPKRVLRIFDPSDGQAKPVILGWTRLPKGGTCDCESKESDRDCAYAVGVDALETTCWPTIPQVQLSLHLLYLLSTGGFGGLIGLLLLQDEARRQAAADKKKKTPRGPQ